MLDRKASPSNGGALLAANNLQDLASAATARGLLDVYGKEDMHRIAASFKDQDALYSDGATGGKRGEANFGTVGAVQGMPLSLPFEIDVPASAPAAVSNFAGFVANPAAFYGGWDFGWRLETSGTLVLRAIGATAALDQRNLSYANFRADYSGQRVRGMAVFATGNTTTSPTIYLQGVDKTASFSLTTAGTPPNWLDASMSTARFVTGSLSYASRFVPHAPILGALTAAEVLEWTKTGHLPTWCEIGTGSAVQLVSNANFSSYTGTADDGTVDTFTSWSCGANLSAYAITGGIRLLVGASHVANGSGSNIIVQGLAPQYGARYRYELRAKLVGNTSAMHVRFGRGNLGPAVAFALTGSLANYTGEFSPDTGGAQDFSFTPADGTLAGGGGIEVEYVRLYKLGPLAKWQIQPVASCFDTGDNKIPLVLTSGITPITRRRKWRIQAKTTTSGNEQLLGASAFLAPYDYTRHMIDSLETSVTGTPTVSIGSASGGAQYKASAALVTGRNRHTLVTPIPASAAIWAASSTADALQHTIRGHLID